MKRLTLSLLATLLAATLQARVFIPNDSTEQVRKVVTGGFKLSATMSGMLLHEVVAAQASPITAAPRMSGEIGGFIDFNCTPHLVVQVNLLLGAEHMLLRNGATRDDLWIFGMNMPVYLLGRYEFGKRGAVQFGGGPFSTFVFRGLMYGDSSSEHTDPFKRIYSSDELTGEEHMVLADNYSGLGITVGYEFWFGLQINLGYQCAISDILNYPHTVSYALPQKGYIGIGYRF
ncbi:MAG: hypothetical protein ACI4BD_05640 [Paludibacteraceae bacterium]